MPPVEMADPAQLRKQEGPKARHDDRPDPTEHYGRNRADQRRHRAGAEFAEFVGSADEHHVDGVDAAAHFVGRP
jgi:hypothetical protein